MNPICGDYDESEYLCGSGQKYRRLHVLSSPVHCSPAAKVATAGFAASCSNERVKAAAIASMAEEGREGGGGRGGRGAEGGRGVTREEGFKN